MSSLQAALEKIQILAPAPKLRPKKAAVKKPKPAPVQDRSKNAKTGSLPRVAIGSFSQAPKEIFGETNAHSESREPPTHDDVFPERFFTGNYTNQPRWYPYVIHKTMKATPK